SPNGRIPVAEVEGAVEARPRAVSKGGEMVPPSAISVPRGGPQRARGARTAKSNNPPARPAANCPKNSDTVPITISTAWMQTDHSLLPMRGACFIALLLCALPLRAQEEEGAPAPLPPIKPLAGEKEEGALDPLAPGGASTKPIEPIPLNAQISQHIRKLAEAERDKRLSFMRMVIDDIARLCELDERQKEDLELAAKGASERSMKEWHEQAERYFRTRLESTDPDAAKEMLD